jgi:hypothetical protein
MIDVEVLRLRRLRNTVLRARAMSRVLDSQSGELHPVFSRFALECWRISRVLTGKLRSHPYRAYQRGPGDLRTIYNHLSAALRGGLAVRGRRQWRSFAAELQRVCRELDDVRALTWSSDLSDTLGRCQTQIRRLAAEADCAAREEGGADHQATLSEVPVIAVGGDDRGRAGKWPYLAI